MSDITPLIRAALETKLSGITGIPPIAWEGVPFTPTTGSSFVKSRFVPTLREPSHLGLNPQMRYLGIYRVECYAPHGLGPKAALDISYKVIDNFEATTDVLFSGAEDSLLTEDGFNLLQESDDQLLLDQLVRIHIRFTEQSQGQTQGAHYMVGVNISWQTFR